MATTTKNLGLTLPAGTDRAEISVLNENFQTLDTFAGQATSDIQQAQETANSAAPQSTTYTKDEVDAAIEEAIEQGGGGTTDYNQLTNKPSINGVTLTGNKTTSDLGIEGNVQADWDEADTTAPSYIKNKPNIPSGVVVDTTYDGTSENAQAGTAVAQAISTKVDKVTGKGLSENDYTSTDKAKLDGIETGAEANVQADWNQTDTAADDYIKNKPSIPEGVVVDQTYDSTSANAQSGIAVAEAVSGKVDKVTGKGLSTNDFTNEEKTKLSGIESGAEVNVQPNWAQTDDTADDYIKNKPTIPAAQVNADWDAVSGVSQILNKPTIPAVDQTYNSTSANAQSGAAVAQAISTKVDKETGKGLSANDFTDTDKAWVQKVESIENGMQVSLFDTTAFSSLSAYLDTLSNGTHSCLIPNNNSLTDVPTEITISNTIVTARIYNINSAVVEAVTISTTYQQYRYTRIKSAGVWRSWYKFEGTAVT